MPVRVGALLTAATLLLSASPAVAASPGGSPADARYTLDLRFTRDAGGTLAGVEAIRFRNVSGRTMMAVWLRTWANGPSGCARRRIAITIAAPARRGGEEAGCTSLQVVPPAPVPPGATATIRLAFRVTVPPANDRFGRSLGDYMIGNAVPILAVRDAHGLHVDEPYFADGESFYSLAANWRATLRLPASLVAATTGTTISDTTRRGTRRIVTSAVQARDFALVIGRMHRAVEMVDGRRIRVWWHTAAGRRALLRDAARAMRTMTLEAGPYRASELDVVQSAFGGFGGMEYPELVMTETWPVASVHEVAHQWFYGMIGDDEYAAPWLDESFATYAERLILGILPRPCDVSDPLARWKTPLDTSSAYFRNHPRRYDEVYTGGACVLYAYERAAGPTAMRSLLHLLLRRFGGGVETTEDVIRAMAVSAPTAFDIDAFVARSRIR